ACIMTDLPRRANSQVGYVDPNGLALTGRTLTDFAAGHPAGAIVTCLPDLGVHVESVPTALQEMEDEPFDAVEEAQPKEIAIGEVAKRPPKQRRVPKHRIAEPSAPLDRVPAKSRLNLIRAAGQAPSRFPRLLSRPVD